MPSNNRQRQRKFWKMVSPEQKRLIRMKKYLKEKKRIPLEDRRLSDKLRKRRQRAAAAQRQSPGGSEALPEATDFRDLEVITEYQENTVVDTMPEQPTPTQRDHTPNRLACHIGRIVKPISDQIMCYPPDDKVRIMAALAEKLELKAVFLSQPTKLDPVSLEKRSVVIDFYRRDEISTVSPTARDKVKVTNPETGEKEEKGKRFMFMTLLEAYELYREQYPIGHVKRSLFCSLKPPDVFSVTQRQRCMCRCNICDNIKLAWKKLQQMCPESCFVPFEVLLTFTTCDQETMSCKLQVCKGCQNFSKGSSFLDIHPSEKDNLNVEVEVEQWGRGEGKDSTFMLRMKKMKLDDLRNLFFKTRLPAYRRHLTIKEEQSKSFKENKANASPIEVVIQVDFAENYRPETLNEAQAAHYSYNQIALFNVVIYTGKLQADSLAIVSDCKDHNTDNVFHYISKTIDAVKDLYPMASSINFWSDNAGSQFKSKFALYNHLVHLTEEKSVKIEWSFFAAHHGKGAVDGIGASVKRALQNKARKMTFDQLEQLKDHCFTAESIVGYFGRDFMQGRSKIRVYSIDAEVASSKSPVDELRNTLKDIPEIQSQYHNFVALSATNYRQRMSTGCSIYEGVVTFLKNKFIPRNVCESGELPNTPKKRRIAEPIDSGDEESSGHESDSSSSCSSDSEGPDTENGQLDHGLSGSRPVKTEDTDGEGESDDEDPSLSLVPVDYVEAWVNKLDTKANLCAGCQIRRLFFYYIRVKTVNVVFFHSGFLDATRNNA